MEVSTIIVKQKDLGCGATKVHIIEQDLEANDAQTRLFWKTLGGKVAVAGNVQYCCPVGDVLSAECIAPLLIHLSQPPVQKGCLHRRLM